MSLLFAAVLTLIACGHYIWTIVVAYRGLTWFLTNFDDLLHIWKRNSEMACLRQNLRAETPLQPGGGY